MRKLIFLIIPALMLVACEKDDNNDNDNFAPACERNETGTLYVLNTEDDPYEIYLDADYQGVISANSSRSFTVNAEDYLISVVQSSGWVLFPTEIDYSGTVPTCGQLDVVI